jgi:exopolyphosphatase
MDESNVILVDHNALGISQTFLKDRIIGIYDHHKDEKQFLDICPRVVEIVGSCSSLIMSEWIRSKLDGYLSKEISSLILSAILLDTINFQESFGRTTVKDLEVYLFYLIIGS